MGFSLSVWLRALFGVFCVFVLVVAVAIYRGSTTLLRPRRSQRPESGRPPGMLPFAYNWPTAHPMKVIGPWPWKPRGSDVAPLRRGDEILTIDDMPLEWRTWGPTTRKLRASGAGGLARLSVRRPGASIPAIELEVTLDREVWLPSDLDLTYRDLRYRTDRDCQITAWFLPGAAESAPTVVALHGMGASRHAMLMAFGVTLTDQGYNVLIPDAAAHGESSGQNTDLVGLEEVRAAIRAACAQPETDPSRIVLVGHSYGAVKAIVGGATFPQVVAVVALACPLTVQQGIRVVADRLMGVPPALIALAMPLLSLCVRLRTGQWLGDADALTAACHLHCPLLVVQGSQDELWTVDTPRTLYNAAMGDKDLIMVPGVDHNGVLVAGSDLEEPLFAFLRRAVGGAESHPVLMNQCP